MLFKRRSLLSVAVLGLYLLVACAKKTTAHLPPAPTASPAQPEMATASIVPAAACDPKLWNHVYHPDRLVVQAQCVTATGTIVDATADEKTHEKDGVRHEADGDTHGWLKLDPGQSQFLNDGNKSAEGGNLVFEIVCKFPVTEKGNSRADILKACNGFENQVVLPPIGSHVAITGTWVLDNNHSKWFEIHPVTSITVR